MATTRSTEVQYPSGDGKPLAETPTHRDNLLGLIELFRIHYEADPRLYVSGNMFVYYVQGDKRRQVSPDVFLVRDLPPRDRRDVYLVWEEGKGPELVIEMTSASTRKEDIKTKFALYRDKLGVLEYFLSDPFEEYLRPSLQGFRLIDGDYVPIEPVAGRWPSAVTGLHFQRVGHDIRLYDPARDRLVPTRAEIAEEARARLARFEEEARARLARTVDELQQAQAELREKEAELERLRRELDARKGRNGGS